MILLLHDIRDFLKANPQREWRTIARGVPFLVEVEEGKIAVVPSTGTRRSIGDSELQRCCNRYNETKSLRATDYHDVSFDSSYLTAILHELIRSVENEKRNEPPSIAADIEPPDRITVIVTRIVRDTARANEIKRLHNYECQLCGYTIERADGSRYAEAHHIQPLGGSHKGLDTPGNIICVCPNCHAKCDLGVIELRLEDLRRIDGQDVSTESIRYHNEHIHQTVATDKTGK